MTNPKRPSADRRGYGAAHRRLRKEWAPRVATGTVRCARGERCRRADENGVAGLIDPADSWDLGHDDRDRSRYTGPEHADCNRATKGRGGTRKRPPEDHPGIV
jgi:hypothetical protein